MLFFCADFWNQFWGFLFFCQLGLGDSEARTVPSRIQEGLDGHKVVMTACGNFCVCVCVCVRARACVFVLCVCVSVFFV